MHRFLIKIMPDNHSISKISFVGVIVSLGIIYGDIGTSPLYVMKAIINNSIINKDFIYGAVSCIIWTLTLQTTIKYVMITLRADNKGEGGILALYALVRRWSKVAFIPALVGSAALLADGIITPSITVTSSIEGLRMIVKDVPVIPIVLIILTALFFLQQSGTQKIGKYFGPIMFFWFLMLGVLGLSQIVAYPDIFKSFNPYYAYNLLVHHQGGVLLLGAVFLCTTGAEALYSDLGHCGIKNIRVSWVYVKAMLILNYLGQGAWILTHTAVITNSTNPFFTIMPVWFLIPGIIIATIAAIIASQALISGSFTIMSEAIRLNLWPKVTIKYPTEIKGQLYIPSINWKLLVACIFVVLFFQESSAMEAAYGLSITITMMMTTILVSNFLYAKRIPIFLIVLFVLVFGFIESAFLYANLHKFFHGGWVTIMMASIIFLIMYIWNRGHKIKASFYIFDFIKNHIPVIQALSHDESVPKYATNLVYFTAASDPNKIEQKIIYSMLNKKPKRADTYWLVHIHLSDDPYCTEYKVIKLSHNIVRIDFHLGFKEQFSINMFFRQVIKQMINNNEFDILSHYNSLRKFKISGDFCFIIIDRIPTVDLELSQFENLIIEIYYTLRKLSMSESKEFGLDTSNVVIETVPLSMPKKSNKRLKRIN